MKTGRKILIFLLAMGILVFILGLAMVGFNFKKLNSGGEYEMKTFETAEQVSVLDIRADNASVTLIRAEEGAGFKAEYEENKRQRYEVSFRDGKFSLLSARRKWYEKIMNFQFTSPKINLYVGEEFDEIRLISQNGKIVSETALKTETLFAETDNGNISFSDITVSGRSDFSSDNGSITLKNAIFKNGLTAETDNGTVSMENVTVTGGANVETNNGKILFKSVTADGNLSGETDNGEVRAENVTASEIYLKTDNGEIKAYEISADKIGMYSSNGNITSTVKGARENFLIRAKTSLGKSNISDTDSGDKSLTVKTSCGNIDVSFSE